MTISQRFNKFYHSAVLKDAFDKARQISFRDWKDTNTGTNLIFYKNEDYDCLDELKQLFKLMNLNYPIEDDGKVSTREITSKELHDHIEWAIKILGENGIELQFIREQWDRLLRENGINKD